MSQNPRALAQQLNLYMTESGIPVNSRERAAILSKMLDIPKQLAWSLLEGHIIPDAVLLSKIVNELDLNSDSLVT